MMVPGEVAAVLFAVKNRFLPTLCLLIVFVSGAVWAHTALGLVWRLELHTGLLRDLLLGFGALTVSDGLIHGILMLAMGEGYRNRYRALVEYFEPQGTREIFAGGLLAGGEELVFRGVLLEGLQTVAGWSALAALTTSAVAFGLLHAIPRRALVPFTVWAVWEGALLGLVYTVSGSLLVAIVVHILHDVAGFSLFAYQRRSRWLL